MHIFAAHYALKSYVPIANCMLECKKYKKKCPKRMFTFFLHDQTPEMVLLYVQEEVTSFI